MKKEKILKFEAFLNENRTISGREGTIPSGIVPPINEAINSKDYHRMADLILKGDRDGSTVAKLIRDKKKAMSRFVAGLKLLNKPIRLDRWLDYPKYEGPFSDLGNLALSLGATLEEIENAYNTAAVPDEVLSKMEVQGGMRLNSSSVSKISKAVIDLGCAIHYVSGNALTHEGKDWMRRNGRKWTIGYKSTITLPDGSTRKFDFDAVTCEGGGPTMYIVYNSEIGRYDTYKIYGILEFTKTIQQNLQNIIEPSLTEQKNLNEGLRQSTIDSYYSDGGEYWIDANSNAWSCESYTEEQAQKLSSSLMEWDCFGCINCERCRMCEECADCVGCEMCYQCSNCTGCTECSECIDCSGCEGLENANGRRC